MFEPTRLFGRSRLRRRILERYFSNPGKEAHVRGLARELGSVASAVGRELAELEKAGVLRSRRLGSARVYEFAAGNTVAEATRKLFEATYGIEPALRGALARIPGVQQAFLFGSLAARSAGSGSDVDVLIVGTPRAMDLSQALTPIEERLGLEVHTTTMGPEEFENRAGRQGFVFDVLSGPHVPLVGEASH
jgi:predicted nucleotidyltransferase